jgi:hypothetical protein
LSKTKRFGIIIMMLAVFAAFAAAQTPTGKIAGKVKDDQGAPLPGVSVEAKSAKLVGSATAVTDETGTYRLFTLPSGSYTITYTLQGFQPVKRENIVLQLEQTLTLDIALKQSTLNEEVTVVGKSPLIDVKSTTKGSTMTKETFMQLPRNRNFDGLLSTVPGVQTESNQGGLSVDGASGAENVFYIDGTNITNIHVGTQAQAIVMEQLEEVKVTASGYSAEFGGSMGGVVNVISRSGGNEFHGDVYGYYNNNKSWMQGKSRDALRLNPYAYPYVAEYFNNDGYYNAPQSPALAVPGPGDYNRYEGVFNLGGYIIKDRLWFFASFNPVYASTYANRFFTSDTATEPAVASPTNIDQIRLGRPYYEFYFKQWNWNGQAKLTAQPFKGMRVALSYVNNFSKTRGSIPSADGVSAKDSPWIASWQNSIMTGTDPGSDFPNWSTNATIDYTASNNFLISLRGGYFFTDITNQQQFMPGTRYAFGRSSYIYPEIPANLQHYQGWTNWAGAQLTTARQKYTRMSGNLDLTYYMNLAGEHAWKFGVQWIRMGEDRDSTAQHPLVALNWGTYYDMPDGTRVQGAYGNYNIRSDWMSPYGYFWNIHSDNWAIYLQDSWTIGDRLTLNFGLRTESEYIPSFASTDPALAGIKPIQFGFGKKLAPRLGAIYDVYGDSSLKLFASFGVYYDVMKLYMAEGSYGGFKWWTSYYYMDNYNWDQIAASGDITNRTDQAAGGRYASSRNWRSVSFDTTDTGLKPVSQSELSFGAEKKITEEISFSARLVYKHLIRTIEDVGVVVQDAQGNFNEVYYTANPGEGWTRPVSQGGRMSDAFWVEPKAKREYYAVNLTLEKRFSNNWQGGLNYTWSKLYGNYGGLASSDEAGRVSPNTERFWDMYFERYDLHGNPLDGNLPTDRAHFIKAYGSYAFPFGLTVGVVAYGRGGTPRTTSIGFNDMTSYPDGYFDTGKRNPFNMWADIYVEYSLRIAGKYLVNLNVTINNASNTSTATGYFDTPTINQVRWTDAQILAQRTNYVDWRTEIASHEPDPRYGMVTGYFGSWTMRFGARFSF